MGSVPDGWTIASGFFDGGENFAEDIETIRVLRKDTIAAGVNCDCARVCVCVSVA